VCSEVCKRLSIVFKLWGIKLSEEQLSLICSTQSFHELRKGEFIDVSPANIVILVDGIFEVSRYFFSAGDILYLEHGGKIVCISHEGRLLVIRKRDLEDILGVVLADRLCRATKLVEVEEHEDVPVSLFIRRVPVVGSLNMTIHEAAHIMRSLGISSIVIVDDEDRPVGIVTDTDLRRVIADKIPHSEMISEIATRPVLSVQEGEPASMVLERMLMQGIKHMVIVDRDNRICGVTTLRDLYDAYTAVPLGYVREIQRSNDPDELKFLYSRVVKQILNVTSRRRVDVEEFSRNFSLFRLITLSKVLSSTSSNVESKVIVLVGGSLLTYDHVFGEDILVKVIGTDESSAVTVVENLRRAAEQLLDLREVVSISMCTVKELLSAESASLLVDVLYLYRPVWGNMTILEELAKVHGESIFAQLPALVKEYCDRIEIPLDFFGRLKLRSLNLYQNLVSVIERVLYYMYLLVTRSRPAVKISKIIDTLAKSKAIDENLARSLKFIYGELKQLTLKIAVEKYIDRLQPAAIIEVDELSNSELRQVTQGFITLRELVDYARDVAGRYTAL